MRSGRGIQANVLTGLAPQGNRPGDQTHTTGKVAILVDILILQAGPGSSPGRIVARGAASSHVTGQLPSAGTLLATGLPLRPGYPVEK